MGKRPPGVARTGLRTRLIAFSVLLVAASIATTAVLAARSTTHSLQQQYSQNVGIASGAYNALLDYATTHSSWSGLTSEYLARLGRSNSRITLVAADHHVIASSDGSTRLPARSVQPAATLNPLAVDTSLSLHPQAGGIDSRALGPFTLTPQQLAALRKTVADVSLCLRPFGQRVSGGTYLNGRPKFTVEDLKKAESFCPVTYAGTGSNGALAPPSVLDPTAPVGRIYGKLVVLSDNDVHALITPTASEKAAATELTTRFTSCLTQSGAQRPKNYPDVDRPGFLDALLALPTTGVQDSCLTASRRAQLTGRVAPPVQLYVAGAASSLLQRHGLSSGGLLNIVLAASLILLLAVGGVVITASAATRPLRSLTNAVHRVHLGETGVVIPTKGSREVAELSDSFNSMTGSLAAADQRRRELISDVAHELRTPLGNIRGWLEAVQDDVVPADRELITSLLDESRHLQSVIDDLQVLALADADHLVLHPELIDLGDVVDRVVSAQLPAAMQKGLELEVRSRGDLGCTADPVRLRQALTNLVANAIRYTDHGSVTVSVHGDGPTLRLSVVDTGVGMTAEEAEHAFDRFWRAEKSRSRRTGGSGLGLAITRHLLDAHGAMIELASTPNAGTTVNIALPRGE